MGKILHHILKSVNLPWCTMQTGFWPISLTRWASPLNSLLWHAPGYLQSLPLSPNCWHNLAVPLGAQALVWLGAGSRIYLVSRSGRARWDDWTRKWRGSAPRLHFFRQTVPRLGPTSCAEWGRMATLTGDRPLTRRWLQRECACC